MDFVEQLKSQLNIADVVGHYVRLKRNGASPSLIGLCPFHSEKTPSFNVHSTRQFYKCFGCDAKGDLINFVMEIEGVEFWDACKILAERYGIPLPQRAQDRGPAAALRDALFEIQEIAARQFEDNLHSPAGAEARNYLAGRGLKPETIREFRLGLADARGQQLVNRLRKFDPELLAKCGVLGKRQDGSGLYDKFRNRLMFPIHNESGKIVAFGGRALSPDEPAKYINSDGTEIYKKSSILYNIHRAKERARREDRIILVEGYMDAIWVWQAGIPNVVASCGTSFTPEQVRLIKRHIAHTGSSSGHVIVNFDPDAGGARGAERSVHLLLAEGLHVKILMFPTDVDPDEFIQQYGAERYLQLIERAPSYFYWLIDRAKERFDSESAEGRAAALQSLWPVLQRIQDRVERNALLEEVAVRFNIDAQLVRDQLRHSNVNPETIKRVVAISSSLPPNERLLLTCMLSSEEARLAVLHYFEQSGIPTTLQLQNVFQTMLSMNSSGSIFSMNALLDRLPEREQKIVSELAFYQAGSAPEEATAQAVYCLRALEDAAAQHEQAELRKRIRAAELAGNLMEALQLASELKRNSVRVRSNGPV
jgi:DNA primase